jgi:hypothetical protein
LVAARDECEMAMKWIDWYTLDSWRIVTSAFSATRYKRHCGLVDGLAPTSGREEMRM